MSTQRNKRTGRRFLTATRRKMQLGPQISTRLTRRTPITVVSVVISGNDAVFTFDQDVILKGSPGYTSANSKTVTGADKTGIAEVTVHYDSAPTAPFTVPFEDPAVRNAAAGYVTPGDYSPEVG
jgi:hypothetical protein